MLARLTLACALLPSQLVRAQATKPNIIHIFADDLGFGSVGFEGQTQIATPNLDALAAGGMTFTNAYAASVCAASRATLYTGFNSGHANVDGNSELTQGFRSDEVMTGTVMEQGGYSTAVFGKWGFGATGVRNARSERPRADDRFAQQFANEPRLSNLLRAAQPWRCAGLFLQLHVAKQRQRT